MFNLNLIKILSRKISREFRENPLTVIISFTILIILFTFGLFFFRWLHLYSSWNVIIDNLNTFIFGDYPNEKTWRPAIWLLIILIILIYTLYIPKNKLSRNILLFCWMLIPPSGIYLIAGGTGLTAISSLKWGGLTLTLILTIYSSYIALPIGIILAIGRQSNFRILSKICITYIDLIRSIPLIAVLFFGQLLIPLFLPDFIEINRVTRAIFAFGLFASAYVAEDVRGGIQSIPVTQIEAAEALGLSSTDIMLSIILPQALKISIPALTNQAVGLLQNTSLISILGLTELLGISRGILANPKYIGNYLEVYLWLALLYWIFCTIIAFAFRNIEKQSNLYLVN